MTLYQVVHDNVETFHAAIEDCFASPTGCACFETSRLVSGDEFFAESDKSSASSAERLVRIPLARLDAAAERL